VIEEERFTPPEFCVRDPGIVLRHVAFGKPRTPQCAGAYRVHGNLQWGGMISGPEDEAGAYRTQRQIPTSTQTQHRGGLGKSGCQIPYGR